jgi:hypothetical protein
VTGLQVARAGRLFCFELEKVEIESKVKAKLGVA